jgi:hypothetical protein
MTKPTEPFLVCGLRGEILGSLEATGEIASQFKGRDQTLPTGGLPQTR